ncbi:SGNH/GDSL hydrolase family protein [Duganella sp. Leaf61]|uniref:SGNH/GDSL hydrolase family protein n=1 Tax=Duganella sp. Leaf61 TaxID=1736227 RepID=UPI0009E8FD9C|nr:SGNH/GDSL hydrolase family protein [Duganella sp. Leaf61]
MLTLTRQFFRAAGLAALVASSSAWAAVTVGADDANLQYTGRIDFADKAAPVISWPGTSIEGNFTGSSLAITLDDQHGKNWFNVFIDGKLDKPVIISAAKGGKTYPVATGLPAGPHRFLITKRTEGEEGATVFRGLELADGGKLLAPPPRKARRIAFFGDSITSGMGNEAPDDGPDHELKDKNNFMAYDAITARALDAEMHVVSQSGIGVMISWFPFIMPQFYDQLSAVGNNDSRWDFSQWTPDVVVINLFQNDKWLIDREKRLQPVPTDAQRIAAYKNLVKKIRAEYPRAYIVCALGSMDAVSPGSKWPGYVSSAVAQLRAEQDERIDTLFFDYTGFDKHPRVKHHQANAAKLTAFIRQKMGW